MGDLKNALKDVFVVYLCALPTLKRVLNRLTYFVAVATDTDTSGDVTLS
jgi:hypothetical protein